jgi:hypothetical protein
VTIVRIFLITVGLIVTLMYLTGAFNLADFILIYKVRP